MSSDRAALGHHYIMNANSLFVLRPNRYQSSWVFDDPAVGLEREPFVLGIDEMIDRLVAAIPQAEQGFRLIFSPQAFPGYAAKFEWRREEAGGNWYRVLLTGIWLMRTGKIEANLVTLNQTFNLSYIPELVARKTSGPEQSKLNDADVSFHEAEYVRLRGELQAAHDCSRLIEAPAAETRVALNDLLVRVRLSQR
jgi:hypothetical protein